MVSTEEDDAHRLAASAERLNTARAYSIEKWQSETLPFVRIGLSVLALIVFGTVISAGGFILTRTLSAAPDSSRFLSVLNSAYADTASQAGEAIGSASPVSAEQFDLNQASMALLTYQSIRHHDRASASVFTRDLLRFSTFLIGAALSFVGALFVVGKFSDVSSTALNGAWGAANASLATASPGIFAIVAGAVLVGLALYAHYPIEVRDAEFTTQGVTRSTPVEELPVREQDTCAAPELIAACEVAELKDNPVCKECLGN